MDYTLWIAVAALLLALIASGVLAYNQWVGDAGIIR